MTSQTLRIDYGVPEGWCGVCRRELDLEETRLVMGLTRDDAVLDKGTLISCTVCRPCLSEHMPAMLMEIEANG